MNRALVYVFTGIALTSVGYHMARGDAYAATWAGLAAYYSFKYGRGLPDA